MERLSVIFIFLFVYTLHSADSFKVNSDTIKMKVNNTDTLKITLHETKDCEELRNGTIYIGVGWIEFYCIGLGYQFSDQISLSLKTSFQPIGPDEFFPEMGFGPGIKLSVHKRWWLNTFNFEITSFLTSGLDRNTFIKGATLNITAGKEKINQDGINFYWAIGLSYLNNLRTKPVISLLLKCGLNFNF